ncbi:MAG TPA: PQQ-dependent sugar dehydrogenase [Xanthobacteraceae bacterium]|nr:PQQ-dependent sugar dehydrogenase [Xanthobacteraceae bacterium]
MDIRRRRLATTIVALSLFCSALPAGAQLPLPPGAMPAPPTPNMPTSDEAQKLKGIPSPPFAAPADKLPLAQLTLPKGFKIEVYASGIVNARSLRLGDKGTVFVGNMVRDKVYAIVDRNGQREVKVIASGLDRPNGLAFKDGTLYIAEGTKISKLENIEDKLDNPPQPVVIYSDLPNHQSHGWKFLALGPDNRLYLNVGAPCNICMPPPENAQLRSIALDGSGMQVVARGIRQVVGMDFHPQSKVLYFTENQRDWLSEDAPQDKLNRLLNPGKDNFGYPYCDGGDIEDPIFGWGHSCSEFTAPISQLGPHSAPLGMRFYTGHMFPTQYQNAIFIARHGSWNKTHKIGGDIYVAYLNSDGTVRAQEPFITGFLKDNNYIGRPVDVMNMADGSLLISDDWNGAVYRVSYGAN